MRGVCPDSIPAGSEPPASRPGAVSGGGCIFEARRTQRGVVGSMLGGGKGGKSGRCRFWGRARFSLTEENSSAGGRGHAGEGVEVVQALAFGQGRQGEQDPLHAKPRVRFQVFGLA